jgi:hypothetical protein
MAASMLARLMGKAVSKTSKKESSEVAKKGTELMGRRDEKFMGMAEEVTPKRLSGPAAKEAAKEVEKKGGRVGAAIAAGATAAGVAAMASRDKEEPKKAVSAGRISEGKVTKEDEPAMKAKEADKKPSTFGAAFKEARAAGKDVFTYEGKKYTTELAGEKKKSEPRAIAAEDDATKRLPKTGVREGRNENIDDDTRKRAMASVANLAKGGMVANKGIGASMKPHNVFGSKGKK